MESRIKITPFEKGLVVKIAGELDSLHTMTYKEMICSEISRHRPQMLLWDLKDVNFLDSAGIGLILGRYNDIRRLGGVSGLMGLNAYSRKIVNLTGLFSIMEEYKSLNAFKKKGKINV